MRRQTRRSFAVVLMALVLALLAGALIGGCRREAPVERGVAAGCYREEGGDKWICQSGGEMEFQSGSTLDAQDGVTFNPYMTGATIEGNLAVTGTSNLQGSIYDSTGATTVGDQLEVVGQENAQQFWVQGYTTQTANLLTVYNSALSTYFAVGGDGGIDARGDISDGGGDLTLADNVVVTGTVDVQGGDITMENDETLSNSTDGVVATDGQLGYLAYVIDKSSNYTVTVAESGAHYTNDGATGEITFTLPPVADGLFYCFLEVDSQTVTIDPDGTDQILSETNAGGDRIQSGAQFDSICLIGYTDGWAPVSVIGTWSDAN